MAKIIHLKLNQHSTQNVIPDASGNDRSATMLGNTQLASDKTFGRCMSLDGNGDYIDCGNGFSPEAASWTVSLWFNPAKTGGENILYNKEDLFEGGVRNGFFQYAWQTNWNWDGGESFPVEIGKWYYATVVYDGQKQQLYRNGIKVYERAQTGPIGSNANKLLLGARGDTNPYNFFAGKIAHFRIYDQALTAAEINQDMAKDTAGLQAHFPLNEHTEDNRVLDVTGKYIGLLKGNPLLIPDETFGAVLAFDGSGDFVETADQPALQLTGDMSLAAWIYIDKKEVNDWVRVVGKGTGYARNYGIWYHPVANQWLFQQGNGNNGFQQVHVTNAKVIQTGKWYHLLGIKAGANGYLYLDGVEIGRVGGMGIPTISNDPLTIGYAGYHTPHSGKIAQVRLYGRALTPEEIQEVMLEDQTAMATFQQSHPIEFSLLDDQEQAVLYIDEDPAGHQMQLNLENVSKQALQFAATTQTEASEQVHHLALHFRPGTLLDDSLPKISLLDDPQWRMKAVKQADGKLTIYLLATHAPKIEAGSSENITFSNFRADGTHGSRGTRVELFYQNIAYQGSSSQIRGERLAHLNIVNHKGKKNIPLHVGFNGGNAVLNDAVDDNSGTANFLKLRLTNALKLDPANPSNSNITLKGKNSDKPTQFTISFDVQNDGENKGWALGTKSQVANIEIRPTEGRLAGGENIRWTAAVGKPGDTFQLQSDVTLQAGALLEFQINNIKSSLPAGHTNLYLHYENIPGYWDGQFVEVIEKSPLIYRTNNQGFEQVGIGTADPKTKLDVNGDVQLKGLSIDGEVWLKPDNVIYVDRHVPNSAANWVKGNEKFVEFTSNYKGDGFRGQVHFYAPSAYYTNVPALTLAGNYGVGGQVGIGNLEPQASLDIGLTGHAIRVEPTPGKPVYIGRNDVNGLIFDFANGQALNSTASLSFNIDTNNTDNGRYIDFKANGKDFRGGNVLMRIQDNGNVGIGTSAPAYKLDVSGMMRAWRYYDDDINFYIDANTTSKMNVIHASIIYDREDTSFYVNPGGYSTMSHIMLKYRLDSFVANNNAVQAKNNSQTYPCIYAKNDHGNGYDFFAAGNLHYGRASSIRLKEDVSNVPHALQKLLKLNGVRFKWKKSGTEDLGFIAEEVGKVIPEAVQFEDDGFARGMSYDHVLPVLVEAVKEQQNIIESLKEQLQQLISTTKNT